MPTVTGTNDIFGDVAEKFRFLESFASKYFKRFGFEELRTPIIEYSWVFKKTLGDSSDIVMHQMYSFEDKDGKEIVLRPEGTAAAVRFFIEKLCHTNPRAKIFYIGPMFRRERPQKGRYRQFHQIGCEMFGFDSPESDAYLIFLLSEFLSNIEIKHKIEVNSVGCNLCRPNYSSALREFFEGKILCEDCQKRRERNPLRILDCKKDVEVVKDAPSILYFLCQKCKTHFDSVINNLEKFGVEFEVNPKIVRGLDYYTGTVFEVFSEKTSLAIAAGGRYDLLVEFMGGPKTPALGFAIGVERVVEVLNFQPDKKRLGLFICYTSEGKEKAFDFFTKVVRSTKILRSFSFSGEEIIKELGDDDLKYHIANRFDISVETSKSLKSQIRYADSQNFRFVAIIGKNEIEKGTITFRDLQNSQQFEMKEDELLF
jgi:histidyl-tRNA synthetase